MANIDSVQDGDWNTASTWSGGAVPTSSDNVIIDHSVTINSNAVANDIEVRAGSLSTPIDWDMSAKVTLICNKITMDRLLSDDRMVRIDGLTLILSVPSISCIGTYSGDGLPTTSSVTSTANTVIMDDPGVPGFSAQMQDIKPEGCARAYARKVSNGVRYMNVVVHIKNDRCDIMGQLYRMAENPFQVLAVTSSGLIKGFIEAITPVDSVGKEYRSFRVSIAEGL